MKTALVVLGMHRSGTSSVAGTLSLLGAAAPRTLMAPAADNPRGFWESQVVMELNDALLAEVSSAWNDWRALARAPGPDAPGRIAGVLDAEFGGADPMVLKDPRMCRLFPAWRAGLTEAGYAPAIVTPLRSPTQVAASLVARNPITAAAGLRLWLRHVLEAEAASRGLPRHLMLWSDFMTDWRGQIALMNRRLGTALAPADAAVEAEVDAFLTPDLHRQKGEGPLPDMVAAAWRTLGDLARHGDHPDLHARMDRLGREFDAACDLFADAA